MKILLIFFIISNSLFTQNKSQSRSTVGFFPNDLECFKNSFEFNYEKNLSNKQDSLIKKSGVKSIIVTNFNKKLAKSLNRIIKKNKKNIVYQSYSEYDKKGNLIKRHEEGFSASSSLIEITYRYNEKGILKEKETKKINFCESNYRNNFYKSEGKNRKICGVSNKSFFLRYDSLNRTKKIKILERDNEITKNFNYSLDTATVVSSDLKGHFLERIDRFFKNDTIKKIRSFSIKKGEEGLGKDENSSEEELFFNTDNKLLKKINISRSKYTLMNNKEYVFKSRKVSFYNYNNDVLQEKREIFSKNTNRDCSCTVKYSYNAYGLIAKIENEVAIPNDNNKSTAITTFEYEFYEE